MSGTTGVDIDDLLDGTRNLGAIDPEQEITALQDLLRAAWGLMTEAQQASLIETDEAQEILNPDLDDEEEADDE
jgi:hypothetical protein